MATRTARKQRDRPAIPDTEWLSVLHTARALGIAYATVLTRVAQGKLEKKDFNGRVWISRESVMRVLAAQGQ